MARSSARVFDLLFFKSPLTKMNKNEYVQLPDCILTQRACTRTSVMSITSVDCRNNVKDVISMLCFEWEQFVMFMCINLLLFQPNSKLLLIFTFSHF